VRYDIYMTLGGKGLKRIEIFSHRSCVLLSRIHFMLLLKAIAACTEYVNDNIYVFVFVCMHMYGLLE
jgi:hypothetical protein